MCAAFAKNKRINITILFKQEWILFPSIRNQFLGQGCTMLRFKIKEELPQ
jgi:hypothetical protein